MTDLAWRRASVEDVEVVHGRLCGLLGVAGDAEHVEGVAVDTGRAEQRARGVELEVADVRPTMRLDERTKQQRRMTEVISWIWGGGGWKIHEKVKSEGGRL